MGILRAVAQGLGGRQPEIAASAEECPPQRRPVEASRLPHFLGMEKTIPISHAEISALYFVVEDFEDQIGSPTSPVSSSREAHELADLLHGVVARWNRSEPEAVYADLFELPGDGP
jgi:hypothetical protein